MTCQSDELQAKHVDTVKSIARAQCRGALPGHVHLPWRATHHEGATHLTGSSPLRVAERLLVGGLAPVDGLHQLGLLGQVGIHLGLQPSTTGLTCLQVQDQRPEICQTAAARLIQTLDLAASIAQQDADPFMPSLCLPSSDAVDDTHKKHQGDVRKAAHGVQLSILPVTQCPTVRGSYLRICSRKTASGASDEDMSRGSTLSRDFSSLRPDSRAARSLDRLPTASRACRRLATTTAGSVSPVLTMGACTALEVATLHGMVCAVPGTVIHIGHAACRFRGPAQQGWQHCCWAALQSPGTWQRQRAGSMRLGCRGHLQAGHLRDGQVQAEGPKGALRSVQPGHEPRIRVPSRYQIGIVACTGQPVRTEGVIAAHAAAHGDALVSGTSKAGPLSSWTPRWHASRGHCLHLGPSC